MSTKPTAFITGASRGIGAAIAIQLAKDGYNLGLQARDTSRLADIAQQCQQHGAKTLELSADVTDQQAIDNSLDQFMAEFSALDVLVLCHGVLATGKYAEQNYQTMQNIIDVNLSACMYITHKTLPYLLNKNDQTKAIIYLASVAAKTPLAGCAAYCASKFGLYGFAHSVLEEHREDGLKIATLNPGYVNTNMVGHLGLANKKMIQPADIAAAVNLILSMPSNTNINDITLKPQQFVTQE